MGGLVLPTITCQQSMSAHCNNIATLIRSFETHASTAEHISINKKGYA